MDNSLLTSFICIVFLQDRGSDNENNQSESETELQTRRKELLRKLKASSAAQEDSD